ncbi:ceramide synthase 1 isoform X2 [Gopherus evgoodei]|uniref:ceramide synthase 1 isoform X2 n=1 Tax=Gopherus evgoodei TaxID=1825980 RepID=UPI0011D01892|nr:ceramide synthase 1 isoform X2 [Gopherus evgoodei]
MPRPEPMPGYGQLLQRCYRGLAGAVRSCTDCGWELSRRSWAENASLACSETLLCLLCAIGWTWLRRAASGCLFRPFGEWCNLQPKDAAKMPESAWKLLFYTLSWSYGAYLLFFTEYPFFHDPPSVFYGQLLRAFHLCHRVHGRLAQGLRGHAHPPRGDTDAYRLLLRVQVPQRGDSRPLPARHQRRAAGVHQAQCLFQTPGRDLSPAQRRHLQPRLPHIQHQLVLVPPLLVPPQSALRHLPQQPAVCARRPLLLLLQRPAPRPHPPEPLLVPVHRPVCGQGADGADAGGERRA